MGKTKKTFEYGGKNSKNFATSNYSQTHITTNILDSSEAPSSKYAQPTALNTEFCLISLVIMF